MGQKTLTILLMTVSLFAQEKNQPEVSHLSPVVKSFLIPGWGEKTLNNPVRSKVFFLSEAMLWLSVAGTYTAAQSQEREYIAFAADYAGVDISGKTHDFWVDIGNYENRDAYNQEHLRFRENDALYSLDEEWNWSWDDSGNRSRFEGMRIRGDRLAKATSFLMGGIVLNHVISAIDAAYLQNVQNNAEVTILPKVDVESKTTSLAFTIRF